MHPRQMRETDSPVRPSFVYSMMSSFPRRELLRPMVKGVVKRNCSSPNSGAARGLSRLSRSRPVGRRRATILAATRVSKDRSKRRRSVLTEYFNTVHGRLEFADWPIGQAVLRRKIDAGFVRSSQPPDVQRDLSAA